jgi:hypothetical protein
MLTVIHVVAKHCQSEPRIKLSFPFVFLLGKLIKHCGGARHFVFVFRLYMLDTHLGILEQFTEFSRIRVRFRRPATSARDANEGFNEAF